ncbi:SMP-30/gluconolactonase/LRE family protein [Actinoplanes aureus]|uniref:SMP-30/gluconolactonase/LRE family protein n=1 Tax=Actinoplanes aureus TaxID=2792083 RepID=A0A931CJA1_9ACTN|nr:SMP-30/gluconolactonase/LRE family protein [Actinoplanes aureus]MBG0569027.1 SMP-30/gluconolactonase/LRE family protein [Actinoplanes aureus]
MTDVTALTDIVCELGESALWDDRLARLYWVDITGQRIFALNWASRATKALDVPSPVGSVALRVDGGLIAVLPHAVVHCDVDRQTIEPVHDVEPDLDANRCNDGAVDAWGRFWFGTMDLGEKLPTGSFYRFDGGLHRAFGGIVCHNGPAWSPDGRVLYHVDSARRLITAYDFDGPAGTVGAGRTFVSDEGEDWFPDGVTVDAEGFVWNCKWDGARIVRYSPDGSVDRVLHVPVPRPTRCAFAGDDLSVLAVTTARIGLRDPDPLSGRVLLLDPGVAGLPAHRYGA